MIKLLICLYIIYKLITLDFIGKIINVILPFILAFVLAYSFYPLLKKINKIFNKYISVFIIVLLCSLILFLFSYFLIPILIKESNTLLDIIIEYNNYFSSKYNIDIAVLISKLKYDLNYKKIIDGVSISISVITKIILFLISFIYILIDMDKIEGLVKNINNRKIYNYLYLLDKDLRKYISSIIKISIISFFEYSLGFFIIGHDNYILMGLIAGITNLIPYIGSIMVLIISILTCPSIIIPISLLYLILGFIDSYIINPLVYDKYNRVNPVLELISMSIGGTLFGFMGIIFSLPITIILLTTYNYFKNDILLILHINKKN